MRTGIAVLAICVCGPVWAESYKNLTLGATIPPDMQPVESVPLADKVDVETLPPGLKDLCQHEFFTLGDGRILAMSDGCDGPVQLISATEPIPLFQSPLEAMRQRLATDMAGLEFGVTTHPETIRRLGSRGLVGGTFGSDEPDAIGSVSLAYELTDGDGILILVFQLPLTDWATQDDQPPDLDRAVLLSIVWVTPGYFALLTDGTQLTPSDGYQPIPSL